MGIIIITSILNFRMYQKTTKIAHFSSGFTRVSSKIKGKKTPFVELI